MSAGESMAETPVPSTVTKNDDFAHGLSSGHGMTTDSAGVSGGNALATSGALGSQRQALGHGRSGDDSRRFSRKRGRNNYREGKGRFADDRDEYSSHDNGKRSRIGFGRGRPVQV